MTFFAVVVAPTVFTRLPGPVAGKFIRALFPIYYLYVGIGATVAAVALAAAGSHAVSASALGLTALVTAGLRQGLMPAINRLSDRAQGGDAGAKQQFGRAHNLSVGLNFAQLLAVAWALAGASA